MPKPKHQAPLGPKRIAEAGLPAPGKRLFLWDTPVPGESGRFGIRVMPTGHASFVLEARYPMRRVDAAWLINEDKRSTAREIAPLIGFTVGADRLTVPKSREIRQQIALARKVSQEWRKKIRDGIDPGQDAYEIAQARTKALKEAAKAAAATKTVDDGIAAYIADVRRQKLRSADEIEQQLRRELLGQRQGAASGTWIDGKPQRWRGRPLASITLEDARALVRAVLDDGDDVTPGTRRRKRGGEWAARHTLATAKTFFAWVSEPGAGFGIDYSPFERLKARKAIGRLKLRQRVLSDSEISVLWRAADREGYPYGAMIKFLLFTGQRLSECAEARWSEIDLDARLWTIAPQRMKMDRAHLVPLAPSVVAWLRTLPRFKYHNGFIFTTREGKLPFSGFSRARKRLDRIIAEIQRADANGAEAAPPASFVLHDLRRTCRTRFSAIPSQDIVRELTIAHIRPGLHQVYDQHAYLDERRDLLTRWAAALKAIVEPPPNNVVPFEPMGEPMVVGENA